MMNEIGMNLAKRYQRPELFSVYCAEFIQEIRSIALDGGAGIGFGESEIQGISAINPGSSAGSGAKTMDEPGDFLQSVAMENFDLIFLGDFCGHPNILAIGQPRLTCAMPGAA
jgi:hypothetical protein